MKISFDGTLTFGVNKGQNVRHVDTNYLEWMLSAIATLTPTERETLQKELLARAADARRTKPSGDPYQTAPKPPMPKNHLPAMLKPEDILEIVSAGRQALAKRYHPDAPGGSHAKMLTVNVAADYLEDKARELVGAA